MRRIALATLLAVAATGVQAQGSTPDACVRNPYDWSARPCTREVEVAQRVILADVAVLAPACRVRPPRWGQDLQDMLAGSIGITAVPGPRPTARQIREEASAIQRSIARAEAMVRSNRRAACADLAQGALPRGDAMVRELRDVARNCPNWSCVQPID